MRKPFTIPQPLRNLHYGLQRAKLIEARVAELWTAMSDGERFNAIYIGALHEIKTAYREGKQLMLPLHERHIEHFNKQLKLFAA